MSGFNELDEMMGFDSQNLDIFNTDGNSTVNNNIYRTNPKNSKTEDGHYHSRVRLLYNPFNRKRSIIHTALYKMRDANGFFMVKSSLGDSADVNSPYFGVAKKCPIFSAWKKFHFAQENKEENEKWAKKMFQKDENDYILVQVVEDNNQPDMVGRILPWKLPHTVLVKLQAKMKPSKDSGKTPVNLLDFLTGRVLDIDVTPGPKDPSNPDRYFREIKYDLCEFDSEVTPIMNVDGTPLFTEDEVETIAKYDKKLTAIAKMKSPEEQAKSYELLKANALYTKVCELMQRAITYLKSVAPNIEEEMAYKPWDEETTKRVNDWIALVLKRQDPAGDFEEKREGNDIKKIFDAGTSKPANTAVEAPDPMEETFEAPEPVEPEDDLPF